MADTAEKLEAEINIKSDPDEFFHSFGGKAHQLPNLCSEKLHAIDLHEGDWKTEGSVKHWTYVTDGKVETVKERFKVDEENRIVTLEAIEGDIKEQYKSYKAELQVISKGVSNFAHWSIEYETIKENDPAPTKYLHWLIHAAKDVDASLLKARK
ncbi:MLP-like protein 34 [Coffea eugenioides]|uniref:MLP-like protein 34 n=1 Tax=Coffea arabica TaxID=13443 RepID=A0A6P6V5R0_COFAR|nr:MLP-like protein 34 [Coffea arabica]XP_027151484.1 MLP-like protein 34 [Coffea eugenioides]